MQKCLLSDPQNFAPLWKTNVLSALVYSNTLLLNMTIPEHGKFSGGGPPAGGRKFSKYTPKIGKNQKKSGENWGKIDEIFTGFFRGAPPVLTYEYDSVISASIFIQTGPSLGS